MKNSSDSKDKNTMSAFLNMLNEIDLCRQAGFVRAALTLALCVPDACRKVINPAPYYEAWCRQYGGGVLQEFADGLYKMRNATVHEMRPIADFLLDISDSATKRFPVQIRPISLPWQYQAINVGALISDIIGAGYRFYELSSPEIQKMLDKVDDGLIQSWFAINSGNEG